MAEARSISAQTFLNQLNEKEGLPSIQLLKNSLGKLGQSEDLTSTYKAFHEALFKEVEKRIERFVRAELAGVHRIDFVHGTLYLTLDKPSHCDFIHKEIRKYYKEFINPEGGVNMYAVGDEFAFDFVPEDREAPVFTDEEDTGVWSEFAEEGLMKDMPDDVDTLLNLEEEMKRGK